MIAHGGDRRGSADLEAVREAGARRPIFADSGDIGIARTLQEFEAQRLDGRARTLRDNFHAAIGQIAHPADHQQMSRLVPYELTKADALHAPTYDCGQCDFLTKLGHTVSFLQSSLIIV